MTCVARRQQRLAPRYAPSHAASSGDSRRGAPARARYIRAGAACIAASIDVPRDAVDDAGMMPPTHAADAARAQRARVCIGIA
jgi:hypothetical protein